MRDVSPSPDGDLLAFVRGGVRWWRRNYRGSAEMKLWLCRPETRRYGPIVEDGGNHHWPMWGKGGKSLFYASDAEGTTNIWRLDLQSLARKKLTDFSPYAVRFPRISRDASVITFAAGAEIYRLAASGGPPRPIELRAPLDRRRPGREHRSFSSGAQEFALLPDAEEWAFVVHGEVFALPLASSDDDGDGPPAEKRASRLTRTPAREKDIASSPDGKSLVFTSDESGNYDLFLVRPADGEEDSLGTTLEPEVTRLTRTSRDESSPVFSPDGERIAFRRGRGDLVVMDVDSEREETILKGWNLPSFCWSPDGKWFAFARSDDEYNTDVFIIPADGSSQAVNITRHPDDDFSPVWFPNGRALAFVSRRNNDDDDVWVAYLRKKDFECETALLWEDWKTGGKKKKGKAKKGGEEEEDPGSEETGEDEEKPAVEVVIDFDSIHLRLRQITSLPGDEGSPAVSPDSLTVAFFAESGGQRGLWGAKWDGSGLDTIVSKVSPDGGPVWSGDGKEIFLLTRDGRLQAVKAKGGKKRTLSFDASMEVDVAASRRQIFAEAWRLMAENFYDPDFHGADWEACRRRYQPLAEAASTRDDFLDAVRMMLGEINASHLGIYPPREDGKTDNTGVLGVDFDPDFAGPGLRIVSVVPRSPADREESRLEPGEVILEANSTPLGKDANIHRILNHTPGRKILLRVSGGAEDPATREVIIRPYTVRADSTARYEDWIDGNRHRVEDRSAGRLAYLHVRGMSWPSFERFERDLYAAAHGKEGLIIDVRNNGGGWTADMLLTVLTVKRHAYTKSRGGGRGYPHGRRPFYAWTKPAATLCNEASFSNAEIFSHAFKTLKRGPLVGRPTYGGVISTGGRTLLDGSRIRMPTRGWWVWPEGPDMELNGAQPDHDLPILPGDEEEGRDPQLDKAVDVLLADMEGGK
jgi:tricorn protease